MIPGAKVGGANQDLVPLLDVRLTSVSVCMVLLTSTCLSEYALSTRHFVLQLFQEGVSLRRRCNSVLERIGCARRYYKLNSLWLSLLE